MGLSEDDRFGGLHHLADMREACDENLKSIGKIKTDYPGLPSEVVEYVEASAIVLDQMLTVLTAAHEKVLELDEALDEERRKK